MHNLLVPWVSQLMSHHLPFGSDLLHWWDSKCGGSHCKADLTLGSRHWINYRCSRTRTIMIRGKGTHPQQPHLGISSCPVDSSHRHCWQGCNTHVRGFGSTDTLGRAPSAGPGHGGSVKI